MMDTSRKRSAIDQLISNRQPIQPPSLSDPIIIDSPSPPSSTTHPPAIPINAFPSLSSKQKLQDDNDSTPGQSPTAASPCLPSHTPTSGSADPIHCNSPASSRSSHPSPSTLAASSRVIVNARCRKKTKSIYLHSSIASKLKEHQVDGLEFIWKRLMEDESGCILAHHMGLGKTIQVIALVTTIFCEVEKMHPDIPRNMMPKRILIMAPLITLSNWMNEFDAWIPSDVMSNLSHIYSAAAFQGMNDDRRIRVLTTWYNNGGVLLINYDQFRSLLAPGRLRSDTYERLLLDPSLVVLDESHRIKNSTSTIATLVKKFKTHRRLCLTGYPLQNNMIEYYNMLKFTFPELIGNPQEFKSTYQIPIESVYADSSLVQRHQAKLKLFELQLITKWVIHRRDASILHRELAGITEYFITCSLTDIQLKLYTKFLEAVQSTSPNILVDLTVLRSICAHPAVFQKVMTHRESSPKGNRRVLKLNQKNQDPLEADDDDLEGLELDEALTVSKYTKENPNYFDWAKEALSSVDFVQDWHLSHKMAIVFAICRLTKERDEKLVIVSHSLATLDFIQMMLITNFMASFRIDGSTVQRDRQGILDRFNDNRGVSILLLSSRAGGIGVNITAASRMILVDLDWNPSYDQQSIGRVYRFGQKKHVHIYHLMTYSTVETVMMAKNKHKLGIASRVVDNKIAAPMMKKDTSTYYQTPKEAPSPPLNSHSVDNVQDDIMRALLDTDDAAIVQLESSSASNLPTRHVSDIDSDLSPDEYQLIRQKAKTALRTAIRQLEIRNRQPQT